MLYFDTHIGMESKTATMIEHEMSRVNFHVLGATNYTTGIPSPVIVHVSSSNIQRYHNQSWDPTTTPGTITAVCGVKRQLDRDNSSSNAMKRVRFNVDPMAPISTSATTGTLAFTSPVNSESSSSSSALKGTTPVRTPHIKIRGMDNHVLASTHDSTTSTQRKWASARRSRPHSGLVHEESKSVMVVPATSSSTLLLPLSRERVSSSNSRPTSAPVHATSNSHAKPPTPPTPKKKNKSDNILVRAHAVRAHVRDEHLRRRPAANASAVGALTDTNTMNVISSVPAIETATTSSSSTTTSTATTLHHHHHHHHYHHNVQ